MRAAVKKISDIRLCSSTIRIAFSAGVTLVYILVFIPLYRLEVVARAAIVLSIMPVFAIAGTWGLWPGLIAGLLLIPLNISLYLLAGETRIADFTGSYFWAAHLGIFFSAGTIGLLRDFQNRLRGSVLEHRQAKEDLQESEERFRRIFEDGPLGMSILDLDDRFIRANARLCEMVGYTEDELKKLTFMDITHPDDLEQDLKLSQQLISAALPRLQRQKRYITKAGNPIWVNITVTVIRDETGKVLYKLAMIEDITERRQAERALRESEERLDLALHGADLGLWDWDVRTGEVIFNDLWAEMLGYSLEEIAPQFSSWEELVHPDDLPRVMQTLNAHLNGQTPVYEAEHRLRTKSGEWEWILARGKVTERDPDGIPLRAAGTHLDITDRKEAEQALRTSEERLRGLTEAAFEAIFLSEKGICLDQNLAAEQMFGYTLEEAVGKNNIEWIAPEDREMARQNILSNYEQPYEVTAWRKDGSTFPVEIRGKMIEYKGRQVRVTAMRDITLRKQAEEALRESEERFRQLFNNSLDALYVHPIHEMEPGPFLEVNEMACQRMGYTREEFMEMTFRDIDDPAGGESAQQALSELLTKKEALFEQIHVTKDGTRIPVEISAHLFDYRGQPTVLSVARDITERKRAEEDLRIQTGQLEALRQVMLDITAELNLNALLEALVKNTLELLKVQGGGIYIYQTDRDMLRWTVAIGEGLAPVGVEIGRGEGVSGKVWETGKPLIVDHYATWEGRALVYEGHNWESILGVPIQWGEEFLGVLNVIDNRPYRFAQADLEFLSLYAAQAAIAIKNARLFDETRSHTAQLERRVEERTAELKNAHDRLKAVAHQRDEFVTSISHELRTPLTSTKLHLHLLNSRPNERDRFMAQLDRETRRLEYIVDQLLYLSRLDLAQIEPRWISVDLNELTRLYVWDRQAIAEQKKLDLSFLECTELPRLQADPMLLERVLGILLDNAFNYTSPGGRVSVSVDIHRLKGKPWAILAVEDTGPGIPLDERMRLFERFFRGRVTLETGTPGSGLGLVIAKEIVEQHQGRIDVESVPGVGSRFKVLLPIMEKDPGT